MEPHHPDGHRLIEHEDALIGHRLTLLVGSQSFLLTAFVLLRNQPLAYTEFDGNLPLEYRERTELLIYLVCVTGIMLSVCTFMSVAGAFLSINTWRNFRHHHVTDPGTKLLWNFLGGLSSFMPGPVLATVWILLLSAEWPLNHVTRTQLAAPILVGLACMGIWTLASRATA